MKLFALISLLLISFISCDNWAVLVAGSNTYTNYRHQSDIFHHYHILVDRGIKPENIIVFAYDDIASASRNPFPGKIFNSPEGKDVYAGVVIDYYGKDVTPENFIAALTGDADSITKKDERTTGKILQSTSEDNVFMFYSDHGSDNLVSFPGKYLYADELIDTFNVMYEKKMYKELVFYLESCHSGSMFDGLLPDNIKIYAVTAAGPDENSYAEYCSSDAKVNGTLIGSCLGDEFSCRFMEDIDSRPGDKLKSYTMDEQFNYLVDAVTGSTVHRYGDLEIAKKSIYEFVNAQVQRVSRWIKKLLPPLKSRPNTLKINNDNYRLEWYRMQAETANDPTAEDEYYDEVYEEGRVYKIFELFRNKFQLPPRNHKDKIDFDCYRKVSDAYADICGTLIDRDFKYMTNIANFCTRGINPRRAIRAFKTICDN